MNEQDYWMVERRAELRRAEMLAEAKRLARRVGQGLERVPAGRGWPYRLANAAVAVLVFLVVVGELVVAVGL